MRHLAGISSALMAGLFARTPLARDIRPRSRGWSGKVFHSYSSGTFRAGRNQEKREARRREKLMRAAQVATETYRPKKHLSHLTVNMLANRRLRQLGRA